MVVGALVKTHEYSILNQVLMDYLRWMTPTSGLMTAQKCHKLRIISTTV